jgi:predicted amidohydrolase YtcJ
MPWRYIDLRLRRPPGERVLVIARYSVKTRRKKPPMLHAYLLLPLVLMSSGLSPSRPVEQADLLLVNGHIITMNPRQAVAQAVAVRASRIIWVGTNADAARRFPEPARRIDLGGATVLPGIIDAHTHLASLGESYLKLNLKGLETPEEAVRLVKERAATAQPGQWIQGWGWDEGKWAAHYPTHEGLTAAAPDNPVYLAGLHSFAAWVNKKALELSAITSNTKDPDKGKIIRNESGEPTGVLTNEAQRLVTSHIPPFTLDEVKRGIALAAAECVRNGLTSVHEARVTAMMLTAFRELIKEDRLPLRVYAMLDGSDKSLVDEWLARGPEIDRANHRFIVRCFKVFADGALGSRGAALLEPYSDDPANKGVTTTSRYELFSITRRSLGRGFQVAVHAIGDSANRMTLDCFEWALRDSPRSRDARLRIEHAQVVAAADIPRFARLGVIASMQPVHCTSDMPWAEKRLGPERVKGAYAWRSIIKTGAHLPLSSDFPGETLNPFYGIYAAVTRQDPAGNPGGGWHPEQRLTLDEALRGYTLEAAYAEFEEASKGSIEEGKLADLVVISGDITGISPREFLSIKVLKTIVDGKVVYQSR